MQIFFYFCCTGATFFLKNLQSTFSPFHIRGGIFSEYASQYLVKSFLVPLYFSHPIHLQNIFSLYSSIRHPIFYLFSKLGFTPYTLYNSSHISSPRALVMSMLLPPLRIFSIYFGCNLYCSSSYFLLNSS